MSILLRPADGSFTVNADGSITFSGVDAGSLTKVTTLAAGDFLVVRRVSDNTDVGVTIASAVASQITTISQLPTVVPAAGDYLPLFDISGNVTGKVAISDLQSLLGTGGGPGGTTGSAPVNTAVPTITGTAQVGQTLTSSQGSWSNSPTSYAYQWNRAGAAISGATSSTYVPVTADVGNALTVTVTATNATGSASATSAATGNVIAAAAQAATAYAISTANSGTVGTPQTVTVTANGALSSAVAVTLSDGASGTFGGTVTLAAGATPSGTTSYTPAGSAGSRTITGTNNGALTNGSVTITVVAAASAYPSLVFASGANTFDTTSPKFGSGAWNSQGAATATGIDLGAGNGNFCVEMWVRGTAGSYDYSSNWFELHDTSGHFQGMKTKYQGLACVSQAGESAGGNGNPYTGDWVHVALDYLVGDLAIIWVNGTNGRIGGGDGFVGGNGCTINMIGAIGSNGTGIDAIKISKVSKYRTDFTPPTTAPTRDANTVVIWQLDGNGVGS